MTTDSNNTTASILRKREREGEWVALKRFERHNKLILNRYF